MSGPRLPEPWGARLRRDRPLAFRFEGRAIRAMEGDTLASALLANGVDVLSRSFKYHRPRGPLTLRGLDANGYVQLGDEPNVPADRLPLAAGMVATGQNYRGSLAHDRDAWIGRVARFLPVGFYYKTFFRPKGSWRYWERYIRAKAGPRPALARHAARLLRQGLPLLRRGGDRRRAGGPGRRRGRRPRRGRGGADRGRARARRRAALGPRSRASRRLSTAPTVAARAARACRACR